MGKTCAQQGEALTALLADLRAEAYGFTPVTPLTHQQVLSNRGKTATASLRDIFGWSLPFAAQQLPGDLLQLLQLLQAGAVVGHAPGDHAGLLLSHVRVTSLDADLFVHSAFPTQAREAVFFSPDTVRFFKLIRDHLPARQAKEPLRIADIGRGSGAGGIMAARLRRGSQVTLTDVNPLALRYARVNAAAAGIQVSLALGDALAATTGDFDLIVSNPPYLVDDAARAYRDGGGDLGRALSVKIASQALQRLSPGGRLILYTGVAMVHGVDHFIRDMAPFLGAAGCVYTYEEIDPDVFGEELARPVYQGADRIAAVGLVAVKA